MPGRQRVDRQRLVVGGDLDDAQNRPERRLAKEFRVDGDEGMTRHPRAGGGESSVVVISDHWTRRSFLRRRRRRGLGAVLAHAAAAHDAACRAACRDRRRPSPASPRCNPRRNGWRLAITACSIAMPFCVFSFSISALHLLQRRDAILVAVDEQARGRAGREEAEVEAVGRRRDRDEALDLRPAHQKLHADPGAERDAGDPAGARLRADRSAPSRARGGVRQFALAVIESALRAADAAEIEAQHGKAALGEGYNKCCRRSGCSSCRRTAGADAAPPRSARRAAWRDETGPPADRRDH